MTDNEKKLHYWINYKFQFLWMYGVHIMAHYAGDSEAVYDIKGEITSQAILPDNDLKF